ncbi:MAG: cytochrome c oxidase assembly protein [Alphaproteobacteria bacterium]|nr:cytochrome c oxidase assembly protein [Alphaproteobacteria bacterium]
MTSLPATIRPDISRKHRAVGLACAAVAAGMVGMSYAAVPLYRMFCQVTGFGGTTQVAVAPSTKVLNQAIVMRFDANVSDALAWKFEPVERKFDMKIGENRLANYRATNLSDQTLTGTATFNVSPEAAGIYFNKIECFCFTEQTLKPGQSVDMPVSFFVDPAFADDPNTAKITQLTLSYTFYPVAGAKAAARAGAKGTMEGGG